MNVTEIPIIDFSEISIDKNVVDWENITVGKELVKAFEDIGFVYMKNIGITQQEIDDFHSVCATFFELPLDAKQQYARALNGNNGYVCMGLEALEQGRPPDLRECFNYRPGLENTDASCPDGSVVPKFRDEIALLYNKCLKITVRVLQLLSVGMGYKDANFFAKSHELIGKDGNSTTLRTLYYPPVPKVVIPNQIRCGEHSDYGSVTLLFQDADGGLQVRCRNGSFIEATSIPDTVLMNIGDLLMRWSSDRFVSTRHRVLLPKSEIKRGRVRQSTAFFVHPDDDYVVECLDGSNKYPPISAIDYLNLKFRQSYGDGK